MIRAAAREVLAAERFATEFEERVGRRDPAHLRAVVAVLIAEERLIRERTIDEVVGVRVMAVEITDVREEAARAHVESVGQRQRVDVRLFDLGADVAVVVVIRNGELTVELVVDVRGDEISLSPSECPAVLVLYPARPENRRAHSYWDSPSDARTGR